LGSEDRHLVFYTRPQCHLCTVAAPRVRRAAFLTGQALQEINIDHQPELAVDYGLRIPVVETSEGHMLAEGEITTLRLWRAILADRWSKTSKE